MELVGVKINGRCRLRDLIYIYRQYKDFIHCQSIITIISLKLSDSAIIISKVIHI